MEEEVEVSVLGQMNYELLGLPSQMAGAANALINAKIWLDVGPPCSFTASIRHNSIGFGG